MAMIANAGLRFKSSAQYPRGTSRELENSIGISTDNNDAYLGSHIILTEPSKDQNVSVLLFNTDSQVDERADARNRIEGFLVPGIKASWEFIGNQLSAV